MPVRATKDRPLYTAVVGGGPSGFYVADAVQRAGVYARIDLFDRLPAPASAPPAADEGPKESAGPAGDRGVESSSRVRPVMPVHEKIAGRPGFRFLGNVTVGRDLTVDEMRAHYDAIILCVGYDSCCRLGAGGGRPELGLYTAGTGKCASGTDKTGSARAVASLLADMPRLRPCADPEPALVDRLLAARHVAVVDFAAWQQIDAAAEGRAGEAGKPRPCATTMDELLRLKRGR